MYHSFQPQLVTVDVGTGNTAVSVLAQGKEAMFGAQCYFNAEVWESQGLAGASLEAMFGAWYWRKPLSTDMGPPATGLAASIATDSHSVGQPAAEGVQISSNHHSFLMFVWGGGGYSLLLAKPQHQTGLKRIVRIRNEQSLALYVVADVTVGRMSHV